MNLSLKALNHQYDWNELLGTKIWNEIKQEWKLLIENKQLKESAYHAFLRKHPLLFLCTYRSYLAISKLKLGANYETDFVIVEEGFSEGTKYELIEIESPHTKLFNSNGTPSAKFNSALQQIRDWRRFLKDNRNIFSKAFPTTSTRIDTDSKLSFKIIIGRRTTNKEELDKRHQISEENNIEIWSYDRLTDILESRMYFPDTAIIGSTQVQALPFHILNELANPFFECTSDSDWRKICKKGGSHIYYHIIHDILSIRKYNEYFDKFKEHINSKSKRKKQS